MAGLYPAIEPFERGTLEVGDGHTLYWEQCGRPDGKPAVALHGGPGSGASPGLRRLFDPAAYRVVLFDQRGCGRSVPHASGAGVDLATNTTPHLLADIERLRQRLGIERWLVFGRSWGATLGLAYACRHPERASEVVLHSVTTTSRREVDWITEGVRAFLPEAWARLRAAVEGEDLLAAYHRRLMSPDPAVAAQAALDWCAWEDAVGTLYPGQGPDPRWQDPVFRLGFARLVTHYWGNLAWLEEGSILRGVQALGHIPAVLVHGRLDLGSPIVTAWEVAQAWPGARLVVASEAGHATGDPGMAEAVVAALDRFGAVPATPGTG